MKKIMNRKSLALVVVALLLVSTFAVAVSAATPRYSNGNGIVYNSSSERVGYGYLWTNNVIGDDSGKALSAQTICDASSANYISATALVKGINKNTGNFAYASQAGNVGYAVKNSPVATLSISDTIAPLDARGKYNINGNLGGTCNAYNLGQGGTETCSDGSGCDFCNDFVNN